MPRHSYLIQIRRVAGCVVLVAVLWNGAVELRAGEPSASSLYKTGRKYEKQKDYPNAYLFYSKAAAKDPSRREYWLRAQALQRRAIEKAGVMPSLTSASDIRENTLTGVGVPEASEAELREAQKPQPPVEITAAPVERDFELHSSFRQLWEEVTKAYGLKVVFDGDYEEGQLTNFRLTGADYRTALHALSLATSSFIVPISDQLLMVVRDTDQKRKEVENNVILAVPIPDPVTVQEAQELARTVQQVMEIQRFAIDSAHRIAVMRDRVSKVRPAQLLFQELLQTRSQVAIEVQLLAWSRSSSRRLGTGLPTSWTLSPLHSVLTLAGGPTAFALSIGSASLVATAAKNEARTLYQAELRSVSGEKASLQVGQKYPIQTLGYVGIVPSGQQAYTPPPSFNFEDLGFNLKITPRVHDRNEVTLDIDSEFKLLGVGSLNGIPVIANRKFATQARLRFDEAALISGLVSRSDARSLTGPAGLMNVPVLAQLLGNESLSLDDVEIILLITPRLLSLPSSELVTRDIWLGSETRPRMPL